MSRGTHTQAQKELEIKSAHDHGELIKALVWIQNIYELNFQPRRRETQSTARMVTIHGGACVCVALTPLTTKLHFDDKNHGGRFDGNWVSQFFVKVSNVTGLHLCN